MSRLKLTGSALFVALLVSWSALRHGLVDNTLPLASMFIRVGVALALAMIGQAMLAAVIDAYRLQNIARERAQEAALSGALSAADDEPPPGT